MTYYFQLQYKLLNRHLIDFGLPPWAGYLLSVLVFVGLSLFLFSRVDLAEYVYVAIAMGYLLNHGSAQRNDFIKTCYSGADYYRIRLIENALIAVPFVAFLLVRQCWLSAGILTFGALLVVMVNLTRSFNFSLPTPFYKTPFEFLLGFRKTFLLVFFAYFLSLMGILVDNFNLGVFSLLLVFLISLTFYSKPESRFYIWVYKVSAKQFLFHKIRTALLHSSILALPVTTSLLVVYKEFWWVILAVQVLGYLYLSCVVLAKYLNFPEEINLPQSIMLGIGLGIPPFLLWLIPFFYTKSLKKLKEVLA